MTPFLTALSFMVIMGMLYFVLLSRYGLLERRMRREETYRHGWPPSELQHGQAEPPIEGLQRPSTFPPPSQPHDADSNGAGQPTVV